MVTLFSCAPLTAVRNAWPSASCPNCALASSEEETAKRCLPEFDAGI